jgi:hypothetical protein
LLITRQMIASQYRHVLFPRKSNFYTKEANPLSVRQLEIRVMSGLVSLMCLELRIRHV